MSAKIVSALLIIIGIIHLLPTIGVVGVDRLNYLYAVNIDGNDIEILMRHRAVLFGLLGGFFCYAAFKPAYQAAALVLAGVSIVSFLILAFTVGDFNAALKKVVTADIIALSCWIAAILLYVRGT